MSKSPTTTKGGKRLPPIHPGKILFEDMKDEEISINGLAQAIMQTTSQGSTIELKAEAAGLKSASVTLQSK